MVETVEALSALDAEKLLPDQVLSSCADILGPRLHEEARKCMPARLCWAVATER